MGVGGVARPEGGARAGREVGSGVSCVAVVAHVGKALLFLRWQHAQRGARGIAACLRHVSMIVAPWSMPARRQTGPLALHGAVL